MTHEQTKPPINWPGAFVLVGTPLLAMILLPWFALSYGFTAVAWISFVVLAILNGISITAGYHRLWAHRAYEAHWSVKIFLCCLAPWLFKTAF